MNSILHTQSPFMIEQMHEVSTYNYAKIESFPLHISQYIPPKSTNLTGKLFCTFWWYILRNVECVKMFENESGIFNDKIELRNYKKSHGTTNRNHRAF